MQFLHTVYCVFLNTFYNKRWNWYLFCLFSLVLKKRWYFHWNNNLLNLYIGEVKQFEIRNQTHYIYNDIINLKNFESNLLKINKNITKGLIFTTLNKLKFKKNDDCERIYSVNPLYLLVNHASGYIEKKMEINI